MTSESLYERFLLHGKEGSIYEMCGCIDSHSIIEQLPYLTMSEIKKLIELGYVDLSIYGYFFSDWISGADALSFSGDEVGYTARHLLSIFDLYIQHDPKKISEWRYEYDQSIPSMFFCNTILSSKSYIVSLLCKFLNAGMKFHDHYWMLYVAIKQDDYSVVEFLLSNGMTILDCLYRKSMDGTPCELKNGLIYEGITDSLESFTPTNKQDDDESESESEESDAEETYIISDYQKIGHIDYCNFYELIKVLVDHDMYDTGIYDIICAVENPYWDWKVDFTQLYTRKKRLIEKVMIPDIADIVMKY